MDQFKSFKLIFCKFKGQSEVRVTSFRKNQRPLNDQLRLKFVMAQKLWQSQVMDYTKILKFKANLSLKVKVSFQTYLSYLVDH